MSHLEPGVERHDDADLIHLEDPTAEAAAQAALGGGGLLLCVCLVVVAVAMFVGSAMLFSEHLLSAIVLILIGLGLVYGAYYVFSKAKRVINDRVSV